MLFIAVMEIHTELYHKECKSYEEAIQFKESAYKQGYVQFIGIHDILSNCFYLDSSYKKELDVNLIEIFLTSVYKYIPIVIMEVVKDTVQVI